MGRDELRRIFDQVELSPEREDALLTRLLTGERRPRMKGKKLSKLAAAAAAAAVLVTCAFAAVATGLDRRVVNYFGAGEEQEALLSTAAVPVDIEVEDSGSTLQVRQVIADRWSAAILIDFTAPAGTVLDGDYYALGDAVEAAAPDGTRLDSLSCGWELLEDEDPADGHISLLFTLYAVKGDFSFLGSELSLRFEGLYHDQAGTRPAVSGRWSCGLTLPAEDPGICRDLDAPIDIDGHSVMLTRVYLSPISLVYELGEDGDDLKSVERSVQDADELRRSIALTTADGRTVGAGESYSLLTTYKTDLQAEDRGHYYFRLAEITDPAEVVSIALFGQTFSLTEA